MLFLKATARAGYVCSLSLSVKIIFDTLTRTFRFNAKTAEVHFSLHIL